VKELLGRRQPVSLETKWAKRRKTPSVLESAAGRWHLSEENVDNECLTRDMRPLLEQLRSCSANV